MVLSAAGTGGRARRGGGEKPSPRRIHLERIPLLLGLRFRRHGQVEPESEGGWQLPGRRGRRGLVVRFCKALFFLLVIAFLFQFFHVRVRHGFLVLLLIWHSGAPLDIRTQPPGATVDAEERWVASQQFLKRDP